MRNAVSLVSLISSLFVASACTFPSKKSDSTQFRKLDFRTAIALRDKGSDASAVLQTFGEPNEKRNMGDEGELWSYFETADSEIPFQRLGIIVHPESRKIESWTWLVKPGESLGNLQEVERLFNGQGKFTRQVSEKWVAGHALVRDTTFENSKVGVSVLIHQNSDKVFVISLDQTKHDVRSTASQ